MSKVFERNAGDRCRGLEVLAPSHYLTFPSDTPWVEETELLRMIERAIWFDKVRERKIRGDYRDTSRYYIEVGRKDYEKVGLMDRT